MTSNRKMTVTPEMQRLLDRTTPLTAKNGGQKLRDLYKNGTIAGIQFRPILKIPAFSESLNFNPMNELSDFSMACYFGQVDKVVKVFVFRLLVFRPVQQSTGYKFRSYPASNRNRNCFQIWIRNHHSSWCSTCLSATW